MPSQILGSCAGRSELTHVVDGAVITAKEEKGASGVIAGDGLDLLHLGWQDKMVPSLDLGANPQHPQATMLGELTL